MTQHQTAEQVSEILARELYVRQVTGLPGNIVEAEREARGAWYRMVVDQQEVWRQQAALLQMSLAESNLAVTWVAK